MIGETGERKSAVATPDGKSRKKKKTRTMCVPRTCYCDDTSNQHVAHGSRGCVALVEHATKGKKHAEKVALRRYLHSIKLKIMLNVY